MQQTVDRFGRLDTLLNNAGLMLLGPVVDAEVEQWERMISIKIQGLLYATRAGFAPNSGRISLSQNLKNPS